MSGDKNRLPLSFLYREGEVSRVGMLMAKWLWDKVIDAGYDDPESLHFKLKEVGDGTLAVGFYRSEDDEFNNPIEGLGFIIPLGFWWTTDDRMPLNWMFRAPPDYYRLPGVEGPPIPTDWRGIKMG